MNVELSFRWLVEGAHPPVLQVYDGQQGVWATIPTTVKGEYEDAECWGWDDKMVTVTVVHD